MAELPCPGCGTMSHFDELRRSSAEFCRKCDYPLFWARPVAVGAQGEESGSDTGHRRLPGTAGRVTVASQDCWSCREPNLLSAKVCVRCGVDLSGPPPAVVIPPPPVTRVVEVVAPPPPKPSIWPWIVLIVLFVVGLVLLLVLL